MATKFVNGESVLMSAEEEAAFEESRQISLPQAKRAARERIRTLRDLAERSFPYLGVWYDASAAGRIAVLANRARISADGFPVRVVALDESETNLSRVEYQAYEAALGTHLQACSAHANTLRQQVNAATTVAAVLAIDLEAGAP
jgi:hypothetical protein